MNVFLTILYIVENIFFAYRYYKKPMGIFSPVFIIAMMSLGVMLPQLTTIYSMKTIYSPLIIPDLVYTMIASNLAFLVGWEKDVSLIEKKITVFEIKEKYLKIFIGIFSLCSFAFTFILKLKSNVIDGVIAFQFQGLGVLGLILSILYLIRFKYNKYIIICLIISTVPIIEYALSIYGSRLSLFTTVLLYAYLAVRLKPNKYKLVKRSFLAFFIVGMIMSMSISDVRNSIHSEKGYMSNVSEIDFVNNLKKSFTHSYHKGAGMDLGNAALCINKVKTTNQYNYGLFLWDGFVFNYVPRRIVGDDVKNALRYSDDMANYIRKVTHNITCTTGYYDAFSSFSYFGFIVFFLMARLFKFFYVRRHLSMFFEMIYLFVLVNSSVAVTHGLQLVFAKFEFVFMIFLCLFFTIQRRQYIVGSKPIVDKKKLAVV